MFHSLPESMGRKYIFIIFRTFQLDFDRYAMTAEVKKVLSPEQAGELLRALKVRFENNMQHHAGLEWASVQARLEVNPESCGR